MYCHGASESVLYTEVSFIQSVLYQRFQCSHKLESCAVEPLIEDTHNKDSFQCTNQSSGNALIDNLSIMDKMPVLEVPLYCIPV